MERALLATTSYVCESPANRILTAASIAREWTISPTPEVPGSTTTAGAPALRGSSLVAIEGNDETQLTWPVDGESWRTGGPRDDATSEPWDHDTVCSVDSARTEIMELDVVSRKRKMKEGEKGK